MGLEFNVMINPPFRAPIRKNKRPAQYDQFEATELYCPRCRQAMPVRKRLLLVLPEGDKYEYLCAACLTAVGDKIEKNTEGKRLILA
ncbi:MAG: cytoplasmic protein [Desulfobacca sp.]|nr:cytoplasmic protein [Desulfobacca sp.]